MIVIRLTLLAVFAVLLTSTIAVAQCTPVNGCSELDGTGCQGATAPKYTGSAKIGTPLALDFQNVKPACGTGDLFVMFLGLCAIKPYIPLAPPIACVPEAPCYIGVYALPSSISLPLPGQRLSLLLPNNPSLINQVFCFQGACYHTQRNCVTLSKAVRIIIKPA